MQDNSILTLNAQTETALMQPKNRAERLDIQDRLKTIIRTVSGHFNLEVTTDLDEKTRRDLIADGQNPDIAWFIQNHRDPKTGKTIKRVAHIPSQIFECHENIAKGKAAHEAGHVAITRHGEIVPDEVMDELGFPSLLAALEERATDNSIRKRLAGAGLWIDQARKNEIKDSSTVKIEKDIPKFCQISNIIVYGSHYDEIPDYYSSDVLALHKEINNSVIKLENTLPHEHASEKEIKNKALARYKIAYLDIWPKVKKIIEQDQQQPKDEQNSQGGADSKNEERNKKDSTEKNDDSSSEQKDDKVDKKAPMSDKKPNEGEDQKNKTGSDETENDDQNNKETDDKKNQKKENSNSDNSENNADDHDKSSQEIAGEETQNKPGQGNEKKEESIKKTLEYLKQIEKELVRKFSGKFNEDNKGIDQENHQQQHNDNQIGLDDIDKNQINEKLKKELEEIERRLRELRNDNTNYYDEIYKKIRVHERALYQELEEIFSPNIKPNTKLKSSGSRISLPAVFKWDAARKAGAKAVNSKIFEVVHIPEKKDYAISLLVDQSGSMEEYGKMDEAFKASILISEVLNRLGVKFEVAGFSGNHLRPYKRFDNKLNEESRNKISHLSQAGGYTNTHEALQYASHNLSRLTAKEKFIITITDGQPDSASKTHNIINHINNNTDQKLIGLGLGAGTGLVTEFFPASIPNIRVEELAGILSTLLKEVIMNPEKFKHH